MSILLYVIGILIMVVDVIVVIATGNDLNDFTLGFSVLIFLGGANLLGIATILEKQETILKCMLKQGIAQDRYHHELRDTIFRCLLKQGKAVGNSSASNTEAQTRS